MVRRLYFFAERVQRVSKGQLPQSVVENLIEIALVLPVVDSRRPADTRMPLGTRRRLLVPIKAKRYFHRSLARCWLATSHRHEQGQSLRSRTGVDC
jgi:hypothetical protein